MLLSTIDWLKEWGCSRSFGLGSRIPWDNQYLIESLSDSTIYMAYYTIAHMLHKDLYGKDALIDSELLTEEALDYVFLGRKANLDKVKLQVEILEVNI